MCNLGLYGNLKNKTIFVHLSAYLFSYADIYRTKVGDNEREMNVNTREYSIANLIIPGGFCLFVCALSSLSASTVCLLRRSAGRRD